MFKIGIAFLSLVFLAIGAVLLYMIEKPPKTPKKWEKWIDDNKKITLPLAILSLLLGVALLILLFTHHTAPQSYKSRAASGRSTMPTMSAGRSTMNYRRSSMGMCGAKAGMNYRRSSMGMCGGTHKSKW